MDEQRKPFVILLVGILALGSLACGLGGLSPGDIELPEVTIPAGAAATAEALARNAGNIAATAESFAEEQGPSVVATLRATDINVEVPMEVEQLGDKFANAQPDANGIITVVLMEEEVNRAIQAAEEAATANGQTSALPNASVAFAGGNAILSGDLSQPVQARLEATFLPTVVNNQLQFDLVTATLGGVTVPSPLLATVEATLNATIGQAVSRLPQDFTLQDVAVGEGTLTVTATQSG